MELYIKPVSEVCMQSTGMKWTVTIMSVPTFALLFVAAMNYILSSVSSLPIRVRSVGVYKCNGASNKDIFSMFLFETAVLSAMTLVCIILLLFAFREHVADMAAAPTLGTLLNTQTIWLPAIMILAMFILSALLPARLFGVTPVAQVSRVSTPGKQRRKRSLFFIQFGGIVFVIMLLVIVLLQYDRPMNDDLGYDPENIVYAPLNNTDDPKAAKLTAEFKKSLYVMATGPSSIDTLSGYGGFPILDNEKNWLFTACQVDYNTDYLSLMKTPLFEGQPLKDDGDILVDEPLMSEHGQTDGTVGKHIYDDEDNLKGRIASVTRDFMVNSFFTPQSPVIMFDSNRMSCCNFTIHIPELAPEYLREMNDRIAELFPDEDVGFTVLETIIEPQYEGIRHFRDGIFVALIAILLVILMGLLGYITDEMCRRSKKAAIRKASGAAALNILRLSSKGVLITTFPAILLGVTVLRAVEESWLRQFASKIPLTVFIFISTALLALTIIWGCMILKFWNITSEDSARSTKDK